MEKTTNILSETIEEIDDIQDQLNEINGWKAVAVKQKPRSCFSKNKGFKVMCEISFISEGEDLVDSEDLNDLNDFVCYKCARLVSCGARNANHSSVITDTDLRCTTEKLIFVVHCIRASLSVGDTGNF
jgi:hypothetical protein